MIKVSTSKFKNLRNTRQKQLILERSASLFYRKGYRSTSMRDIARACHFEPANIYHYFSSKEQILYDIFWEAADHTISAIASLESDSRMDPAERLRCFVKRHFETPVPGAKPYYMMFDMELKNLSPTHRHRIIEMRDEYDRILRKIIQDGLDDGTFVTADVKLAGYAIASMIVRSRLWFSPKGRLSAEEVANFMCAFTSNALGKSTKNGPI
jgi:AcrR family transcriptional regulator